jgi:hypothetical protein
MTSRTVVTEGLLAVALVAVALIVHGPLFVRSPLGPDPVMYDLQAQLVGDGGVLYQDILEPNLPGAVWMHLVVRWIGGSSPEALRVFDLVWFCAAAWLATRLIGGGAAKQVCVAIAVVAGYTTLSEWCHCQRDVWMLPFVLGAVLLRVWRLESLQMPPASAAQWSDAGSVGRVWKAILEGVLWGAAVWLKPHVVVPAVCVVAATWFAVRGRVTLKRQVFAEFLVVIGGAIGGGAGVLWLVQYDAWRPLWIVLTEWNRDYVAASASRWSWGRLWSVQERLAPWSLVHLFALPIAITTLVSALRDRSNREIQRLLAAAMYIGWIAQALLLQHLFDYVHAPAMVLGVIVIASAVPASSIVWTPQKLAVTALLCLVPSIVVRGEQLAAWSRCLIEPSTELRAILARLPLPEWNHLARVTRFLDEKGVKDGELTAYHTHTIHLYPALGVRPSTRFVFTETHLRLFPSRAGEIAKALAESNQRYVVSDLLEAGLDPAVAFDESDPTNWQTACPRDALTAFPFDQPVIFRSGPYLVHEVTQPVGPVETGFFPLAAKTAGL